MWRATGNTPDGKSANVPLREIDELDSRDHLLSAVRQLLSSRTEASLNTLARELASEDPLPGIDGIDTWGEQAAELIGPPALGHGLEYGRYGETASGREIHALSWVDNVGDRTTAFHCPEAIVADVTGFRDIDILAPHTPFEGRLFLEWRGYLGTSTLVAEGEAELEEVASPGGRLWRARLWLQNKVGFVIGRIVCIIGKPPQSRLDPSFSGRLRHYEKRYPEIAKACPDVGIWVRMPVLYAAPARGPMIIFVHGTLSCSLPNLALLHPLRVPTFRFEHDTFQSITENADKLVKAVTTLLQPDPLHLIAHSRGGLVTRLAARKLSERCRVVVRTYGTPHLGTPLANAGGRAWKALLSMGRTAVGGVFSWDPASLAIKLFFRPSELPPGLSVMKTDSDTLRSWTFGEEPFELVSYGGTYDEPRFADGASAYTFGERVLHESFGQAANDLVVPTASALGAGQAKSLSGSCDHFSYFARREVQDELRGL